ncbi:MAG: hypothetical protein ACRDJT_13385 [Actinomycetota bacterium]
MSAAVTVLVLVAIAFVVSVGLTAGLDVYAALILGLILGFGALALAIARRSRSGAIGPGRCHECDGVLSSNAPYCKHCGARLGPDVSRDRRDDRWR